VGSESDRRVQIPISGTTAENRARSYALCSRDNWLAFFSANRRVLHAAKFITGKQLERNSKETTRKLAGTEYIHRLTAEPSCYEVNLLVISIRVVYAIINLHESANGDRISSRRVPRQLRPTSPDLLPCPCIFPESKDHAHRPTCRVTKTWRTGTYHSIHLLAVLSGTPYRLPASAAVSFPSSTRAITLSRIDWLW
jgi:hypothetical protein